jgi:hypothetical protein
MRSQYPDLFAPTHLGDDASDDDAGFRSEESVTSYEDLMRLYDEPFVAAAYRIVLGRKPDEVGLDYYCRRLRQGYSRVSVLDQLNRSSEALRDWQSLPGATAALQRYRASRRITGWKLALRDPELGRLASHKRARALENAFAAQRQTILSAIDELAAQQRSLEKNLAKWIKQAPSLEQSKQSGRPVAATPPGRPAEVNALGEVPRRYSALLRALRF